MAARVEAEAIETNGKPAKGAPVIRRLDVADEDVGSRVLNRLVPALVISGALHVVVIGSLVAFMSGPQDTKANESDLVTTQVEEPKEDDKNLTNADVGFDPDLAAATNTDREETVNVEAPKVGRAGRLAEPAEATSLRKRCLPAT